MRIVHVLTRLLRAGSEENTLLTCRAQAAAGAEVYVVHGREFNPCHYESLNGQMRFLHVGSLVRAISPEDDFRAYFELLRLFRRLKPDVVHTHQSKAGIIGRFAAYTAGVPVIVHGVHIVPFAASHWVRRTAYLAAERAAAAITDGFVDVCAGVRDLCLEAGVGRPEQHFVVHSGFDLGRFRAASPPEDWRAILRLGADEPRPPVLLLIAAFEPRKRHRQLLSILPGIVARFPSVRLLLAGEGPLRSEVEAQAAALALERHVIFTGFRDDPERLIALADIGLITSIREGLPRVLMQYLAGGKPCVACELPALGEVLRHGVNGLIVRREDMTEMAAAIVELLQNPEKRNRLAQGARATDLSSWDASLMGARTEAAYRMVFDRSVARSSEAEFDPGHAAIGSQRMPLDDFSSVARPCNKQMH